MSNQITQYLFPESDTTKRKVRAVMRDDAPWFVAADVCAVLGIENHRDAVARLDDDERGSVKVDTLGGVQSVAAINESGLYTLILRCRDATTEGTVAHRFRKWVTAEVLPSIRKTGSYQSKQTQRPITMSELKRMTDTALQTARQLKTSDVETLETVMGSFSSAGIDPSFFNPMLEGLKQRAQNAPKPNNNVTNSTNSTNIDDAYACLNTILDAEIKVDGIDYRVRDLISQPLVGIDNSAVKRALGMYGLRIDDSAQRLLIANSNGMLSRKILAKTAWSTGWNKTIQLLPESDKPNKTVKIGGTVCRCVSVPINTVH
ncbi:Bro-N domain-containing protein [Thiospirillum jenense]